MTDGNHLVYVVDDDEVFREALSGMLESAGYRVATYATAEHFLAASDPAAAACVVVDVRMPGMSGLELQEELLRRRCALPVIFVTGHGDVPTAVAALKKGAVDFIEKPVEEAVFLARIGDAVRLSGTGARDRSRRLSAAARLATLTQRECEVLRGIVAGRPNKVIAEELGISVRTVEAHRARIMEKTGTATVAELVQIAIEADAPRHDSE